MIRSYPHAKNQKECLAEQELILLRFEVSGRWPERKTTPDIGKIQYAAPEYSRGHGLWFWLGGRLPCSRPIENSGSVNRYPSMIACGQARGDRAPAGPGHVLSKG